jgi:hypothetical protein
VRLHVRTSKRKNFYRGAVWLLLFGESSIRVVLSRANVEKDCN